jgi:hypothetical protein
MDFHSYMGGTRVECTYSDYVSWKKSLKYNFKTDSKSTGRAKMKYIEESKKGLVMLWLLPFFVGGVLFVALH